MPTTADTTKRASQDRPAALQPRGRLSIKLHPDAIARVEALAGELGGVSLTEVVRRALQLFDYLVEARRRGARLQLVEDGEVTNIELLVA